VTFTFQSDHPEDFSSVEFGCGWVAEDSRLGYIALDHSQQVYIQIPPTAQRAMALEDSRARREAAELEAGAKDREDERVWRARSMGFEPSTPMETATRVFAQQDRVDRREAARVRMGLAAGELEVAPVPPPSLRSEAPEMRRRHAERKAAEAARQVQGSELDALRQEVTHLKALLAARGVR
jgi:hypothetical protein